MVESRITQRKGDIAKAAAIHSFTCLGYDVAVLVTESAHYDIIVDVNGCLKKVQVQFCGNARVPYVRLRRVHYNSNGATVKRHKKDDWDWMYVYTSAKEEYLLTKFPNQTSQYTLRERDRLSIALEMWLSGLKQLS